jgi:hypothetical protein
MQIIKIFSMQVSWVTCSFLPFSSTNLVVTLILKKKSSVSIIPKYDALGKQPKLEFLCFFRKKPVICVYKDVQYGRKLRKF